MCQQCLNLILMLSLWIFYRIQSQHYKFHRKIYLCKQCNWRQKNRETVNMHISSIIALSSASHLTYQLSLNTPGKIQSKTTQLQNNPVSHKAITGPLCVVELLDNKTGKTEKHKKRNSLAVSASSAISFRLGDLSSSNFW